MLCEANRISLVHALSSKTQDIRRILTAIKENGEELNLATMALIDETLRISEEEAFSEDEALIEVMVRVLQGEPFAVAFGRLLAYRNVSLPGFRELVREVRGS
jgi:hypothetical protein